jgi:hypothetical protein
MPRPVLDSLRPGDPVIVTDPERRSAPPMEAHVVKAARVWITIAVGSADDGQPYRREWKMRRDTQNEANSYGWGGCQFVTPEQHAWDQQADAARRFLAGQGIDLRSDSPWRGGDRLLRLADLLNTITAAPTA